MSSSNLSGPSDNSAYPQYIQDNANKLGITAQQYQNIADSLPGNVTGATYQLGGQGNQGWNQTVSSTSEQNTYDAVAQQVRLNQALGGGKQQQAAPTQPTTVAQNPMYDITNLGAAALGEQAVYNPEPGPADPKSGIGTVTQPQVTKNKATAPSGPWSTTPGLFTKATALQPTTSQGPSWDDIGKQYGFGPGDTEAFQRNGWTPTSFTQAAKAGYGLNDMLLHGPYLQQSLQLANPTGPLTATPQATAAQMPTTQTPAASFGVTPAPAAPGVSVTPAPLPSAPGAPGPMLPQGVQQAMGQMPGYIQQAVQQATAQMPIGHMPENGAPTLSQIPGLARGAGGGPLGPPPSANVSNANVALATGPGPQKKA